MSRVVFSAFVALSLQACGVQMAQHRVLDDVERRIAVAEAQPQSNGGAAPTGSIRVAIDDHDGALNLRNGRERGNGYYETYEIPPLPEGADAEEYYDEFFDQLREEHGTRLVLMFRDFPQAFALALNHHLRRYFAHVETPVGGHDDEPNVRISMDLRDNGIKRAVITLRYGNDEVGSMGERRTRRHLAWAVPLNLVLPVIGQIILQHALGRIHARDLRHAIAEAIDNAAVALAAQIAEQCRPGSNRCIAARPSYRATR